ncbi:MAG: hypothetical protein LBG30_00825 [Odoribacteraceae bacterium]|jgi:hypothetical protein|nr:hypothetical protein [Odoribacteraceae bacterium]
MHTPWRKRVASTMLLLVGLSYMIWPTPVLNHMQEILSVTLCLVGISILIFFWRVNKKEPVYRVLGRFVLFSIGIVYALLQGYREFNSDL